jgi:hypothetical protein
MNRRFRNLALLPKWLLLVQAYVGTIVSRSPSQGGKVTCLHFSMSLCSQNIWQKAPKWVGTFELPFDYVNSCETSLLFIVSQRGLNKGVTVMLARNRCERSLYSCWIRTAQNSMTDLIQKVDKKWL